MKELLSLFNDKKATVGVIGLGYVGLPLAVEAIDAGYKVVGIDIEQEKIEKLNSGESYIQDISSERLSKAVETGRFHASCDYSELNNADAISICVPTPLRKTRDPDISFIVHAVEGFAPYLRKGQLIVLESTTYPGTTEEIIQPILERNGFKAGRDFYLAFSPERVDPGNPIYNTHNTPKVVGGVTDSCGELASAYYGAMVETVIKVGCPKEAEMVKLLENTFRSVNIGLVNELALMCNRMDIDIWRVVDAAATKPFGFMPFWPGPGLGGHCIPIDPHYLSWKAKSYNFYTKFIELAGEINGNMPRYVVARVQDALNEKGKALKGSRILVSGVAYKADIDDTRESPAIEVILLLLAKGAEVGFYDPFVEKLDLPGVVMTCEKMEPEVLSSCDCVVITTHHKNMDYDLMLNHSNLILDTRNAFKKIASDKVVRL